MVDTPDRAVEEVAYRNRPPLLEDVSIRGPLRIPVKDSMVTLEERDAIEADFRWYRYSKFAAPWLLISFLLLVVLFCLTAWQQVGNYKKFNADSVGSRFTSSRLQRIPKWKIGVPRIFTMKVNEDSKYEGGLPKYLRNLRIATVVIGITSVALVFFTLFVKPRPKTRAALNYLWALLLIVTFVLACIGFAIGIAKVEGAVRCPPGYLQTFEKCTIRKGVATLTIASEAGIAFGALISTILLVFYTSTGDWKLFRTGWRERERDAETDIHNDSPEQSRFRKVREVRITLLTIALIFTLICLGILLTFLVILRENRQVEWKNEVLASGGIRGRDLNEQSGWPSRNTRLRYSFTIVGILTILINLYPFVHRAIHYLFFFVYFLVSVIAFVTFGFDAHELHQSRLLPCEIGGDKISYWCDHSPFYATVCLEFLAAIALLVYFFYEFVAKSFTKSKWSQREYAPHELHKHDSKLDSLRPVRCEVTGKTMTAKEYVYRWRFIAGTAQAQPVFYPEAPVQYVHEAPISYAPVQYAPEPYVAQGVSYVAPQSTSYIAPQSTSYIAPQSTSYIAPQSASYVVHHPAGGSFVPPEPVVV